MKDIRLKLSETTGVHIIQSPSNKDNIRIDYQKIDRIGWYSLLNSESTIAMSQNEFLEFVEQMERLKKLLVLA